MIRKLTAFYILLLTTNVLLAQPCTNIGQTPQSAFPVCGITNFTQNTVPICGSLLVPTPCNDPAIYQDKNPYWYKFTCYTGGTLGFIITPNNLNDDYDWQLFDVTNQNPSAVFTNPSLFVACNWSGYSGITGASSAGTSLISCAGNNPIFSRMPTLIQGHQYLLLISHWTDSQSGYQLQFTGGTASITEPNEPHLSDATISCDGLSVRVKLNKPMKCATLATNGSDFSINGATIIAASASLCTSGFDTDSLVLNLGNPLPAGNYSLVAQNGIDGNTLLDNCDRAIPQGETITFTVTATQPTPMDSIKPVGCSPSTLELVFRRPISCNSIAPNGSDFLISGPQPISISSATGNCQTGATTTLITLELNGPIVMGGTYQVQLNIGTDGNTLLDECGRQTPAGSTVSFITKDTVSAEFNYTIRTGCTSDTVSLTHDGAHGVNSWSWSFDNGTTSASQNPPLQIYSASSQHTIKLVVTNGVCTDNATVNLIFDNQVKASFQAPDIICPEETAKIINTTTGVVDNWLWTFGNGSVSDLKDPPAQPYPQIGNETSYQVKLIASNISLNCRDTAIHTIRVLGNCFIAVPSAFSPNGDGLNDYLYPLNALKADDLEFKIFNRWGQLVFETKNWLKKWDGTMNGKKQTTGMYVWFLRYTHHDTGEKVFLKGTSLLIR